MAYVYKHAQYMLLFFNKFRLASNFTELHTLTLATILMRFASWYCRFHFEERSVSEHICIHICTSTTMYLLYSTS